jgi:hypothetical protein
LSEGESVWRGGQFYCCLFVVGLLLSDGKWAEAGLSGPPQSRVETTPDGLHILVYLSPAPLKEDYGRIAVIPDVPEDRTVDLRETFPASGCYSIGSTTPLWTAPWDGKEGWVVSDDGRYLVQWNIFGDGGFAHGGSLSWALKFYDGGRESKHYDVSDLLDFPSLMFYTTWDWHYLWYADRQDNLEIHDGQFFVDTSTHERYRFDVATGEILEERHFWRPFSRSALFVAAIVIASTIAWRFRRSRSALKAPFEVGTSSPLELPTTDSPTQLLRFSVRHLLVVTTGVAIATWIGVRWPQVLVFLAPGFVAVVLTRSLTRLRRAHRYARNSAIRRLSFGLLTSLTITTWPSLYLLSAGPVYALLHRYDAPEDVRSAITLTIYRPVTWLDEYSNFLRSDLFKWYGDRWGLH